MRRRARFGLAVLAALFLAGCTGLFFQPYRGYLLTPDQIGISYENVFFTTRDGLRLNGWFLPAKGKARGTVYFLHGNAQNISTHIGSVWWLPSYGFNVFLIDYRGYGLSQGTASVPAVFDDIESGLRALVARRDVDPHRIVLLGQSLGGSLAVYALTHSAYRADVRALVIDSAFASFRGIAREKLAAFWLTWPFQIPLSWTVDDAYSPIRYIDRVSPTPLLIIHSRTDQVVPVAHALSLYAAAKQPKQLWLLPHGDHIATFNDPANRVRLVRYLTRVLDGEGKD